MASPKALGEDPDPVTDVQDAREFLKSPSPSPEHDNITDEERKAAPSPISPVSEEEHSPLQSSLESAASLSHSRNPSTSSVIGGAEAVPVTERMRSASSSSVSSAEVKVDETPLDVTAGIAILRARSESAEILAKQEEKEAQRRAEERAKHVLAAKEQGYAALKAWEEKRADHSLKLKTTGDNNRTRLVTQLLHGLTEVGLLTAHLEARCRAHQTYAATVTEHDNKLAESLQLSGLAEVGVKVQVSEEQFAARILRLTKYINEELIGNSLKPLSAAMKKSLNMIKDEEAAATKQLNKVTAATAKAFSEYSDLFLSMKKSSSSSHRKDLWLAELKYRVAVDNLLNAQQLYQDQILRLFASLSENDKSRLALVKSVLEAYSETQINTPVGNDNKAAITAPVPRPMEKPEESDEAGGASAKRKEKKVLKYRLEAPLPDTLTCAKFGVVDFKPDKKTSATQPILLVLTNDRFIHGFDLDVKKKDETNPHNVPSESVSYLAAALCEAPVASQPLLLGTALTNNNNDSGSQPAPPSYPPPPSSSPHSTASHPSQSAGGLSWSSLSSNAAALRTNHPDPIVLQALALSSATPLFSLDVNDINLSVVFQPLVDPLTMQFTPTPDAQKRKRSSFMKLFKSSKTPVFHNVMRARTKQEAELWVLALNQL